MNYHVAITLQMHKKIPLKYTIWSNRVQLVHALSIGFSEASHTLSAWNRYMESHIKSDKMVNKRCVLNAMVKNADSIHSTYLTQTRQLHWMSSYHSLFFACHVRSRIVYLLKTILKRFLFIPKSLSGTAKCSVFYLKQSVLVKPHLCLFYKNIYPIRTTTVSECILALY